MNAKINVEDYSRRRKPVPVGVGYEYELRVNKDTLITTPKRFLSGREILELAGKSADDNQLVADYGNGIVKVVAGNDMIDVTQGVIKFNTSPLQAING